MYCQYLPILSALPGKDRPLNYPMQPREIDMYIALFKGIEGDYVNATKQYPEKECIRCYEYMSIRTNDSLSVSGLFSTKYKVQSTKEKGRN